jgi:hypothetical protein
MSRSFLAKRRATGLTGIDHVQATSGKKFTDAGNVAALASAINALEGNEFAARHKRVRRGFLYSQRFFRHFFQHFFQRFPPFW